jgi:GGDEF domain-containing protein
LLADIDGFTAYNTEFGEDAGDACLRSIAEALRSAMHRPADVLGRYAGGKFALLLPETDAHGASAVAQRITVAVDALKMPRNASLASGNITVSLGVGHRGSVASTGPHGPTNGTETQPVTSVPADLIATAEVALKNARSAGGHRTTLMDITELACSDTSRSD